MKLLFMCPSNSALSQLAEGLARQLLGSAHDVRSAGKKASHVSLLAVRAMRELGVSLETHVSKDLSQISPKFLAEVDYVISLGEEDLAPESIPAPRRYHWPMLDPAQGRSSVEEQLQRFRHTRDLLSSRLEEFAIDLKAKQSKN
jgi:arsenate reductase